jgi:hypothetical protein
MDECSFERANQENISENMLGRVLEAENGRSNSIISSSSDISNIITLSLLPHTINSKKCVTAVKVSQVHHSTTVAESSGLLNQRAREVQRIRQIIWRGIEDIFSHETLPE